MKSVSSKKRQKQVIRDLLMPQVGINADKVDLEAQIDSTCTLQENWNSLKRKLGVTTIKSVKADIERYKNHSEVNV